MIRVCSKVTAPPVTEGLPRGALVEAPATLTGRARRAGVAAAAAVQRVGVQVDTRAAAEGQGARARARTRDTRQGRLAGVAAAAAVRQIARKDDLAAVRRDPVAVTPGARTHHTPGVETDVEVDHINNVAAVNVDIVHIARRIGRGGVFEGGVEGARVARGEPRLTAEGERHTEADERAQGAQNRTVAESPCCCQSHGVRATLGAA